VLQIHAKSPFICLGRRRYDTGKVLQQRPESFRQWPAYLDHFPNFVPSSAHREASLAFLDSPPGDCALPLIASCDPSLREEVHEFIRSKIEHDLASRR
jgi:hypothetical protein